MKRHVTSVKHADNDRIASVYAGGLSAQRTRGVIFPLHFITFFSLVGCAHRTLFSHLDQRVVIKAINTTASLLIWLQIAFCSGTRAL